MDATICNGCEQVTTIADASNKWIRVQIRGDYMHFCTNKCLMDKILRDGTVMVVTRPEILGHHHGLYEDDTVVTVPDLPADFPG